MLIGSPPFDMARSQLSKMKPSDEYEKSINELTELEFLKQFANLIIDIYFDQLYEKEKQQ
jgi:hypothetical protein